MLPSIRFDAGEAFTVAADLTGDSLAFGAKAWSVTRMYGMLLQTKVKAYASKPRTGPPGPRIQTGDYVRSISLDMGLEAGGPTATVGTNKPQGRRLEFGFVGIDSIGRHYNQPPYPHFRPALEEVAPLFQAAIAAVVVP